MLDWQNSPLTGYFVQKFQNIMTNRQTLDLMMSSSKKNKGEDISSCNSFNSQVNISKVEIALEETLE